MISLSRSLGLLRREQDRGRGDFNVSKAARGRELAERVGRDRRGRGEAGTQGAWIGDPS
jgi:hypothetical protein